MIQFEYQFIEKFVRKCTGLAIRMFLPNIHNFDPLCFLSSSSDTMVTEHYYITDTPGVPVPSACSRALASHGYRLFGPAHVSVVQATTSRSNSFSLVCGENACL